MKANLVLSCRACLFAAAALLIYPAIARSANPPDPVNHPDSGDWSYLDLKKVMAAAAEITPASYRECDEATVDAKIIGAFRPDGTGEMQYETYLKVLTEKGKRDNRTLRQQFYVPYNTAVVDRLEVIKPDGSVRPVDVAANAKEGIDSSQMEMNIYDPNERVLTVSIPELDIGDVVHSVVRVPTLRAFIPGEVVVEEFFEGVVFIRHIAMEVRMPEAKPLRHLFIRDPVAGTVKSSVRPGENHSLVYDWAVTDVPRMHEEPNMPTTDAILQRVMGSTIADWPAVSRWYWGLSKTHLEATTAEMRATVAKLTAGATTDPDRIKAIFYYVSKNVRYMGVTPEKDRPGFEPHDVSLTFGRKYGVCRDKAALLVSMLRSAGFHAYPVLVTVVGADARRDPEVPDTYFVHAIVAVEQSKGDYLLMDPTNENTRDLLPGYECNQSYLVCRPEGEGLRISPINPPEENMMRVQTTGALTNAGTIEAKSVLWFDGINDTVYRDYFANVKPDDRRRVMESLLKWVMPGASLNSLAITPDSMLDMSAPLHIQMEFTVPGMATFGNREAIVSPPWVGKAVGLANFILKGAGLEKRRYPMVTIAACGIREEFSLKLGEGFAQGLSLPSYSPVNDACVHYERQMDFRNGALTGVRELKLKVLEFTPEQYLQLKQTLAGLDYDDRKVPVLSTTEGADRPVVATTEEAIPPPVESDSQLIEDRETLAVQDSHTAVLRVRYVRKILTYSGKKKEAEVKIPYNPATQEARIIRAVVISPTGKRQEISQMEKNVMDAEWNVSAKRYTGGKILVGSLPGVEIGSTIEVELEIAFSNRPYLAGFEPFQLADELTQKTWQITAPAGLNLWRRSCGPTGILAEHSDTTKGQAFEWSATNVKALPAESFVPPDWAFKVGVAYFAGDPAAYYQTLHKTMLDRAGKSAQAGALARQLAAATSNRLEALRAIRDYVAQTIRPAGPDFGDLPLEQLSNADTTLADGYGHTADRAILLDAMLAAAGFQPEFVLASDLPSVAGLSAMATTFPLPTAFQNPLVRVTVDGAPYYLNDTDQYGRLGSTPHDGMLALAVPSGAYETIQAAPDSRAATTTTYTLSFTDNSKARIGIRNEFYGPVFNEKNKFFTELPPEEKERYFQQVVSKLAQGARPVGGLTTRFDGYPGVEEFTVEIDRYAIADGKFLYFKLPFTTDLIPVETDARTLPLYLPWISTTTIRVGIELPAAYRQVVIAPKDAALALPDGAGSARITTSQANGNYMVAYELRNLAALIAPGNYPAAVKVESALENKGSKVILLENTSPASTNRGQ